MRSAVCVASPDVGGAKMARGFAKRLNASLAIIDDLGAEWASGTLVGKPAAVFTSTARRVANSSTWTAV